MSELVIDRFLEETNQVITLLQHVRDDVKLSKELTSGVNVFFIGDQAAVVTIDVENGSVQYDLFNAAEVRRAIVEAAKAR